MACDKKVFSLQNMTLIQITFNNPNKTGFCNRKYAITIKASITKVVNGLFLIKNTFLIGFLKFIGVQN